MEHSSSHQCCSFDFGSRLRYRAERIRTQGSHEAQRDEGVALRAPVLWASNFMSGILFSIDLGSFIVEIRSIRMIYKWKPLFPQTR